jgi:DNA polymerase-3 subunit gamma/tau
VASEAPAAASELGDRWVQIVRRLLEGNAVTALTRELAWQAGLLAIDTAAQPPVWRLQVERQTLQAPALTERLQAAMIDLLGEPLRLQVQPGAPADSPALRDAEARARRQREAEAVIQSDPVVQALLAQFDGARIVPGSIKPI